MQKFAIQSFDGVGPLKFGMTREEVRQQLKGRVSEIRKSPESVALWDQFLDQDIIAIYDADYRLEALEFYGAAIPTWNGSALLGRQAKAIFDDVKSHSSAIEIDRAGATFHDLGFGLYSPGWLEGEAEQTEGAIAFKKSYYAEIRVTAEDSYNLQRFLDAQNPVWSDVWNELRQGHKQSHWMWFIFPQIAGLGHSPMAQHYAISSLQEAEAYLDHCVLGPRLRECLRLIMRVEGRSAREILGSPDDMKLRSCLTLFAHATKANQVFRDALQKYFDSEEDPLTLAEL